NDFRSNLFGYEGDASRQLAKVFGPKIASQVSKFKQNIDRLGAKMGKERNPKDFNKAKARTTKLDVQASQAGRQALVSIGRNISMLTQALQTGHKPQADKAGKALAKAWGVFTRVEQYFARPVSNPAVVLINPKQ